MRWVGNVACMTKYRNPHRVLVTIFTAREHSEYLGLHDRIILK
jgi:hypothetical protein